MKLRTDAAADAVIVGPPVNSVFLAGSFCRSGGSTRPGADRGPDSGRAAATDKGAGNRSRCGANSGSNSGRATAAGGCGCDPARICVASRGRLGRRRLRLNNRMTAQQQAGRQRRLQYCLDHGNTHLSLRLLRTIRPEQTTNNVRDINHERTRSVRDLDHITRNNTPIMNAG